MAENRELARAGLTNAMVQLGNDGVSHSTRSKFPKLKK